MSLVRIHDVDVTFDRTPVLREVFLKLAAGDRIGLIGRNGSGKSTILELIRDRLTPDRGTVDVDEDVHVGTFSQFSELTGSDTVVQVLTEVFAEVVVIEAELAGIEAAFADPDADIDALVERQAELLAEMERLDGWSYPQRIERALSILGFRDDDRERPVDDLSGGWRNRAALAKILLERPDVLLLDEPTNYLDVPGIEWLESWLADFRGALLVVSHDRAFLDNVVTQVIEIENHRLHRYDGDYTQYIREKPMREKSQERQFVHEGELLVLEAEGIARRRRKLDAGKGTNRKLANVKKQKKPRLVDQIVTDVYRGLRVKDELCTIDTVTRIRDDRVLFDQLTFHLRRRDRLAIVGPNGCGKSSLIDILVGAEPPDAGEVRWARGAGVSHFNQVLADLDPGDTVTHAVNALPPGSLAREAPRKQIKRFLTLFQFSELDQQQRIGSLSGGQRARVALAQCLLSGASTVVLDEPTNHLDVTSTQVMERALTHFPGAVVIVSHDRFFLDTIASRRLMFTDDGVVIR